MFVRFRDAPFRFLVMVVMWAIILVAFFTYELMTIWRNLQ